MNRTSTEKRARIIACLAEGNSIRATSRLTGAAKNTIVKLLCDAGRACSAYQDKIFHNLKCKRIQCDEIWSFVYAKDKNLPEEMRGKDGVGSVWTWTALDSETKLVPCWFVGSRDAGAAYHFMHDLAGRLAHRVQLTTDGHKPYLVAVEDAFGADIDYATLQKIYGLAPEQGEVRYSPAQCMGARKAVISGNPDFRHVSTSHTERRDWPTSGGLRQRQWICLPCSWADTCPGWGTFRISFFYRTCTVRDARRFGRGQRGWSGPLKCSPVCETAFGRTGSSRRPMGSCRNQF